MVYEVGYLEELNMLWSDMRGSTEFLTFISSLRDLLSTY